MDKMVMILRKQTFKDNPCLGCMYGNSYGCRNERDAMITIGLGDCLDDDTGNNYIYVKGEINFE